jgi:phage/plasmid-associated DNA primase
MNTDLVKAVVAGDWVTGREVYKKPSKFRPYAKHYLGMNTLPDIEDNTHGMWRRIHVIEFPRKFAEHEMDVELTEKLMGELSGIFNWALEGYKRLDGQKTTEGNKKCFPKKEFRTILEKEGIKVANSSKHANQLRVFGVKYEVVYE